MSQRTFELLVSLAILIPFGAFIALEIWVRVRKLARERDLWFRAAIHTAFTAHRETANWDWPRRDA